MAKYQLVIMAAGKGTRMRSELPKVLHRLCGLTLIERVIRAGLELKPSQIIVVTGFGSEMVEAEVCRVQEALGVKTPIRFAHQTEQRGTGHAVFTTLPHLNGDRVFILPGDMPLIDAGSLNEIAEGDEEQMFPDALAISFVTSNPNGYGRIVRNSYREFLSVVEERDATAELKRIQEVNSSLYCADRDFLTEVIPALQPENAQNEFYLTDILEIGKSRGKRVDVYTALQASPFIGANSRAELAELDAQRRVQINRNWMDAGVTMEDPERTYIDEYARLSKDCFLGSGTRVYGTTVIEDAVRIEGDTLIRNSVIGQGTEILLGCHIEQSKIGRECRVGPFAHLRAGSVLEDQVHLGNFVETKKTRLGKGAKANHLTYLGDSEIGADVNVGAGTITCNYDGYAKHQTTIGEGAFIGSNTALVAPVKIGARSVVGAGSVISQDVPEDALALERTEQRIIHGWARKRRERN